MSSGHCGSLSSPLQGAALELSLESDNKLTDWQLHM